MGKSLLHLGELFQAEGKYKAGLSRVRDSLIIREQVLGFGHPEVAESVNVLAEIQVRLHHFEEAETNFLRAWDVFEKTLGPDAPGLLRTQTGLAALYFDRACYEEADRLLAQLTQSHERIFFFFLSTVRTALTNQMVSFEAQDRMDEAFLVRKRLSEMANGKMAIGGGL